MLTSSRHPGLIHVGHFTYKPFHGALGFMMSCAAGVLLVRVLLRLFQEDVVSESSMRLAAVLSLFGCLLFYWGTTWFFSFITGYSRKLIIGENGIRFGPSYFSWPQVARIGVRLKRGCYQVELVLQSGWHVRRRLVTDDGMTGEMSEEFIQALKREIQPRFPGMEVVPASLGITRTEVEEHRYPAQDAAPSS